LVNPTVKEQEDIEEYSFSQTTLEQVFLTFAKENEENDEWWDIISSASIYSTMSTIPTSDLPFDQQYM